MQLSVSAVGTLLAPYEALVESFDALHLPRRVLGRTLYDTEIVAYRFGDDGPDGIIAAGAHAEEVAGVTTAFSLARSVPPGVQGWIVPCRDPLGWDGFRRMLARAAGKPVRVRCHGDVAAALKACGEPVRLGDVAVGIVGDVAFFSVDESHPGMNDPAEFAYKFLAEEPEVRERLAGKRLFVHGSPLLTEGRDIYDWGGGPTIYVNASGRVGNMNRFFSEPIPPMEVAALRTLADEVRPAWTLDLHEGFGSSFFLFTSALGHPVGEAAARAMAEGVAARGFPLMSRAEMASYFEVDETSFIELAPGVYVSDRHRYTIPDAFCPYVGSMGAVCFTTEMGMENPLQVRMEMTEVAARAGLEVLQTLQ